MVLKTSTSESADVTMIVSQEANKQHSVIIGKVPLCRYFMLKTPSCQKIKVLCPPVETAGLTKQSLALKVPLWFEPNADLGERSGN